MKRLKICSKVTLALWCSLLSLAAKAQNPNEVEMADLMHENGKIYVVIGVLLLILGGMFVYLISLNRKISKLEKELG
jgi:hypothetical protein